MPKTIQKAIYDLSERLTTSSAISDAKKDFRDTKQRLPKNELKHALAQLEKEMKEAAKNLEFEKAAELRDQVYEMRGLLADLEDVPPWKRARMLAGEIE